MRRRPRGTALASNSTARPEASASAGPEPVGGTPARSIGRALVRALRPHQWSKNLLLLAPLLLAHRATEPALLGRAALAFAAFSLCASAGYVLNDLVDREADRAHPRKRTRPFAAGDLSARTGYGLIAALLALAFGASAGLLGLAFTVALAVYLGLTVGYSLYLKERLVLDVLVLAGLYTHRVVAGGIAVSVEVSQWLLAFSLFFFLCLAFAKRYTELRDCSEGSLARRGYRSEDLGLLSTLGPAAGYLSILVLALYVTSDKVTRLYDHPAFLWGGCAILLYWLTRIWFLAVRGELHDDPVLFAVRDPQSYAAVALVAAVGAAATL